MAKISQKRFFDPDIENEQEFKEKNRRAMNKQRAKSVLEKYNEFKVDKKLYSKKKKIFKLMGGDQNMEDTIPSEMYQGLAADEDSSSEESKAPSDIFAIAEMALAKRRAGK